MHIYIYIYSSSSSFAHLNLKTFFGSGHEFQLKLHQQKYMYRVVSDRNTRIRNPSRKLLHTKKKLLLEQNAADMAIYIL